MSYSYTLAEPIGQVRLLIPDRIESEAIFQDEEISGLLALEAGVVKRAAALALETISSDEVLVQKVIKTLNLQTDGAKVADALLKRAAALRVQARTEAEAAADDDDDGSGYFDVAEVVVDTFSSRARWRNEGLRDG